MDTPNMALRTSQLISSSLHFWWVAFLRCSKDYWWIRKLPHQVDNSKLEIPVLNVLGMNSMGVLSPRESWGLNSL
jgi:hypothetical protein